MTHPSLSLMRRPGAIVILDDDRNYLEMLATVLPKTWDVRLYQHPKQCLEAVLGDIPLWEQDLARQQQLLEHAREGASLIPLMLDYWSHDLSRYSLAQVCVLDYAMPGMDGVATLQALGQWQGGRIMLTGQADEHLAVSAFNQGLISQFIPKQTPDILNRLMSAIQLVQNSASAPLSLNWRKTLRSEQQRVLRLPGVGVDLAALAQRHWVEHVVLGEPFGILGLSASGHASWLQLETTASLEDLAELAASLGIEAVDCDKIRKGLMLAGVEFQQSLGLNDAPACQVAQRLGEAGEVIAALFDIAAVPAVEQARSYANWLSQQHVERLRS